MTNHTDAEYQFRLDDIAVLESVVASQKERIKELEAENERLKNGIADLDEYISKQIWRERD